MHGNLAFRHDGTEKYRESDTVWINPLTGQLAQTLQSSEVFVHRAVGSAALGIDYGFSDLSTLSLSARYNDRRSRPTFDVLDEVRAGGSDTIFHRISEGPNQQSDDSASLTYNHNDNSTAFKAMVQRSDTTGLIDKSYRDVYVEPALSTGYSRGTSRSVRHLTQGTVDWTRSLERSQWGLGLDILNKIDDVSNYEVSVDPLIGTETPRPLTTNGYAVTTTIAAAYLTDQIRQGSWEVLLGGRAEETTLQLKSAQDTLLSRHWLAFNPSVHLRYALSDSAELTLSYRSSLQMPDPRDLNPYTTYVDVQNLSRGNPDLKPQRMTSWEIGRGFGAERVSGSLNAFYRTSSDTVTDARSFSDSVLVTSKQNGGRARSAGVTGSIDWKPPGKLRLGIDGGAYYVMLYTPDLDRLVRQNGVAGYMNLRAAYSVGLDDVSVDAHAQSAAITPLGRYGATSSLNVTWKHPLTKTLSFTLNANDIFDGSRRTYSTHTSTFRQTGFKHFVARRIYVGFVKKFG